MQTISNAVLANQHATLLVPIVGPPMILSGSLEVQKLALYSPFMHEHPVEPDASPLAHLNDLDPGFYQWEGTIDRVVTDTDIAYSFVAGTLVKLPPAAGVNVSQALNRSRRTRTPHAYPNMQDYKKNVLVG